MQSLMKGKGFFKAQHIYIYIYIYIWKVDKGVAEIKFCYLMFACEESCKACEESCKDPCENTSKPPLLERIFGNKFFYSFENSLLGYSRSLFPKGKPRRLMPISVFLKVNVQRLWIYRKL